MDYYAQIMHKMHAYKNTQMMDKRCMYENAQMMLIVHAYNNAQIKHQNACIKKHKWSIKMHA